MLHVRCNHSPSTGQKNEDERGSVGWSVGCGFLLVYVLNKATQPAILGTNSCHRILAFFVCVSRFESVAYTTSAHLSRCARKHTPLHRAMLWCISLCGLHIHISPTSLNITLHTRAMHITSPNTHWKCSLYSRYNRFFSSIQFAWITRNFVTRIIIVYG